MNKTEFLREIANETGATLKDTTKFYDAYVNAVQKALKKGEKIALVGFGTYEAKRKPARECLNPMTGAKVKVAACNDPALKFGKNFKESLN